MRLRIKKRMNECFEDPYTNGIFEALDTLEMPWTSEQLPAPLDMVYFDMHSGEKLAAPIITNRLGDDGYITSAGLFAAASCLKTMYYTKWSALWEALQLEYNPIENYSMTESGSDDTKRTGTDTNVKTGSTDNSGAITRTGSLDHSGALTRTGSLDHSGALTKTGSLDHSGALTRTGSTDHSGALTKTGSERDQGDVTRSGKEKDKTEFTSEGTKITDDNLSYEGKDKTVDKIEYRGQEKTTGTQGNNQTSADESIYGYNSLTAQPSSHRLEQASHEDIKEYMQGRDDERTITKEFLDDRADNRHIEEGHSQDFLETTDKEHEYVNVKDHTDTTHTYTDVAETDTRKETYNNIADTDTRKETYNNIAETDTRKETYSNIADTDTRKETYNNIADTDTRKETYNNIQDQMTHNTDDLTTHSLTRSGNIGVTTTQQMLQQEIELRRWNYFYNVMADIDALLTLSVY